jgi:hypothetical protein
MEPIALLRPVVSLIVAVGIFSAVCSPVLGVDSVRPLLETWPSDRLVINYLLSVTGVVIGHWVVMVALWEPLGVGSSLPRLLGVVVGYPVALSALGAAAIGVRNRGRPTRRPMTLHTVAGLGLGVVLYIAAGLALAFVLFVVAIFTALPA